MSFARFRKLPREVREHIWLFALPPRVIAVFPTSKLGDEPGDPKRSCGVKLTSDSAVTSMLDTCKEARAIFKRRYTNVCLAKEGLIYIDLSRDTIFLEWGDGSSFDAACSFFNLERIESLAIDFTYCAFDSSVYSVLQSLRSLRQLRIVYHDSIWNLGIWRPGNYVFDFRDIKARHLREPYTSITYMQKHVDTNFPESNKFNVSLVETCTILPSSISTDYLVDTTRRLWTSTLSQYVTWKTGEKSKFETAEAGDVETPTAPTGWSTRDIDTLYLFAERYGVRGVVEKLGQLKADK